MAYIWQPDNTSPLIRYRDNGNGFSVTVTVTGDPDNATVDPITGEETPPPDPDMFEVSGLHPSLSFSYSGNTWTVSSTREDAIELFPIRLTYLLTDTSIEPKVVNSWNELPDDAKYIIKMETIANSPYITSFSVTSSVDGVDPETKTYSIEIIHTFDSNGIKLREELEKRGV